MEIVPPVARPGVTEGLGTGSVRPLFRARKVLALYVFTRKSNRWRRGDLTTGCFQAHFTPELGDRKGALPKK